MQLPLLPLLLVALTATSSITPKPPLLQGTARGSSSPTKRRRPPPVPPRPRKLRAPKRGASAPPRTPARPRASKGRASKGPVPAKATASTGNPARSGTRKGGDGGGRAGNPAHACPVRTREAQEALDQWAVLLSVMGADGGRGRVRQGGGGYDGGRGWGGWCGVESVVYVHVATYICVWASVWDRGTWSVIVPTSVYTCGTTVMKPSGDERFAMMV
ncbi:uncharacterized protein H6S33_007011 [Morchella sextelata]|uniref:uncharacterized protein n=1 Tax=Morchella sextelata TaxID=1174677 RepID=UPI001D040326|nr:uncharacterized protein H6S33_007011 [Morchella sextelata]KAH0603980.1 hypothetical protein H6S33_007011 [Morchella sextelata]